MLPHTHRREDEDAEHGRDEAADDRNALHPAEHAQPGVFRFQTDH